MNPRLSYRTLAVLAMASALVGLVLVRTAEPGRVGARVAQAQEATTVPDLTGTAIARRPTDTPRPVATWTATASAEVSPDCWTVFPAPATEQTWEMFKSVAGSSPADVWAVGNQGNGDTVKALAMHWDGSTWSDSALPDFGSRPSRLYGVTVISPSDAWAVGSVGDSLSKPGYTLIVHWDGSSWQQVTSPNPTENINELEAVAAVSSNDVWAAGYFEPSAGHVGGKQALLLRWNGQTWARVDIPGIPSTEPYSGYSTLESIAVISSNDIWAAGSGPNGFNLLTLHWDGATWSMVPTPEVSGLLHGISAVGPDDVWAVGNSYPDQRSTDTLTMHWDGNAWSIVPDPYSNSESGVTYWLEAVAAFARDDVWAVGYLSLPRWSPQLVIERWDGAKWNSVPDPTAKSCCQRSTLYGAARIADDLWAVGIDYDRSHTALLLRHKNLPCDALTPTPKPILNPPVPLPGAASHTFPQTGRTVSGIFLAYWQTHGGLMQQGYPISGVMGEASDLDGKVYTTQYFERAVFEYHPENRPPYNVLLSQLGTFEYSKKYPNGAPNQRPSSDPLSVYFPQTRKKLGGKFLQYWQTHGGLMQQGYPISDEFTEISPANRLTYTVQYFERAVFEYHPENAPPYDVLLSLLGRFQYERKYRSIIAP